MSSKRKHVLLGVAGVLAMATVFGTGCGRKPVMRLNGIAVYEHVWVKAVDGLAPQAAYDLHCPEPDLAYVLLERRGRHPSQIGVEGCGRRVIYQRMRRRGWAMVAEEVPAQPEYPDDQGYPPPRYQQPLPPPEYHPG